MQSTPIILSRLLIGNKSPYPTVDNIVRAKYRLTTSYSRDDSYSSRPKWIYHVVWFSTVGSCDFDMRNHKQP